MRKALLLLASLFIFISASAQKVTEKKLLGYWAMASFESSMGIVDFKQNKATLSDSEKKGKDKAKAEETEKYMFESLEYFRNMYIEFKPGSIMKFNMDGESEGVYSIFEKGNKQYLIEPGMDKASEEVMIELKNNRLYLSVSDDEGGFITMSYEMSKPKLPAKLGTSIIIKTADLLGAWKVVEYTDEDGTISETGAYKLVADIKKTHSTEEIEQIEEEYKQMADVVRGLEFVFSPRVVVYKHDGEEFDRGTYYVESEDKTYIEITFVDEEEEETQDVYELYSKDNALYLKSEDGSILKCVRK